MKPLVVIPARGGSKGIFRKNIKPLNGKPLINYTIEIARSLFDDGLICVTTDDSAIKDIVESQGLVVPFIRPKELATDNSGMREVILHAVNFYEANGYYPDTIILLQVTSPLRTKKHLEEALLTYNADCEMVVSVKETKSNPYYILTEENPEGWLVKVKDGNYSRRQDCPKVYEHNGSIYIINTKVIKEKPFNYFRRVRKYVMDEKSSIDIDDEIDWIVAENILMNKNFS